MNQRQQEAYDHTDGPLLILAGAGSGKTFVLTKKITKLMIEKEIKPSEILALTFTNKAAAEMRERVDKLLSDRKVSFDPNELWIKTFDSFSYRIVKQHASKLGFEENIVIFSEKERTAYFEKMTKSHKFKIDIKTLMNFISRLLSEGITIEDLENQNNVTVSSVNEWKLYKNEIILAYKMYKNFLKSENTLDVAELIVKVNQLFENFPEICDIYVNQFKYIFIDEYQDTSEFQFQLVKYLTNKPKPNIVVVGDDDQSIYGFRGADITNILSFENRFTNSKIVKLEQNYRSTQNIVYGANALIEKNIIRTKKTSFTTNKLGKNIRHIHCKDEIIEAEKIALEIKNKVGNGAKYSDFALLYRKKYIMKYLLNALQMHNIPCLVYKQTNFNNRKEINDILAFIKIMVNPESNIAVERALTQFPNIAEKSIKVIHTVSKNNDCSYWFALTKYADKCFPRKNNNRKKQCFKLAQLIKELTEIMKHSHSVSDIVNQILNETNYIKKMRPSFFVSKKHQIENIKILQEIAEDFDLRVQKGDIAIDIDPECPGVSICKAFINLLDSDEKILQLIEKKLDCVKLMTIHGSKGLEFKNVYIVGFEEGIMPSSRFGKVENLEEERRIAYVAMTRAQKELTLCSVNERTQSGVVKAKTKPSIFLTEIKGKLKDRFEEYKL